MKGIRFLAVIACALMAFAARGATVPERGVDADLSVMGYGYRVKVLVNGIDSGVTGGGAEGMLLFSKDHSLAAKAAPSVRDRHALLKPGANEIAIEYAKLDPKTADRLEITFKVWGYPKPLLRLVNSEKASDKLSVTVQIEKAPPAGFKPVLIGDAKVLAE